MDKYKVIAIVGRSSAGKNTVQKKLYELINNSHSIIGSTTRPKRENEIDGVEYYFLDINTFTKKLLSGELIEAASYNHDTWFYGTSINELEKDKINIGIFNPTAIECMEADDRIELQIIYIKCPDKQRLQRSLARETYPNCREICRRFLSEDETYEELEEEYDFIVFDNSSVNPDYKLLLSQLDSFIK